MRKEVLWFAENMEKVLAKHDHLYPNGWSEDTGLDLSAKLYAKSIDLEDAIFNPDLFSDEEVVELATDVANFAMMIADKYKSGNE